MSSSELQQKWGEPVEVVQASDKDKDAPREPTAEGVLDLTNQLNPRFAHDCISWLA